MIKKFFTFAFAALLAAACTPSATQTGDAPTEEAEVAEEAPAPTDPDPVDVEALKGAPAVRVLYRTVYNGKVTPMGTEVVVSGKTARMTPVIPADRTKAQDAGRPQNARGVQTATYVDYGAGKHYRRSVLPDQRVISTVTPFKLGQNLTPKEDQEYMGLKCKVVGTSINSNSIEVWYTDQIPYRGTPNPSVGVPDGLVLRVIRNGNSIVEATEIQPLAKAEQLLPASWGEVMEAPYYQYAINQSGVITIPVFDEDRVCFNGARLEEQELAADVVYPCGGGTIILKKVSLPEEVAGRDIFVEVVQYSEGDAYDRTGSVFVIPTAKAQSFIDAIRDLRSVPAFTADSTDFHGLVSTPEYDVPVELMRFFTGFGVRQFNHNVVPGQKWVDSVLYKTEVTALAEHLQGEAWIGAYVGNWDAKGHRLTVKLKYYPEGERRQTRALPLFNTVNYLEQAGQPYPTFLLNNTLEVPFTLTEDAPNAQLFYLTTGHGGWGGGDEFNQKPNTILLDGKKVITFIPWRDDCATTRNNNPCSGNFSNGLSSSDLSRSNWCPGTVTNPEYIVLGDLKAGRHVLTVQIPQGAPEGTSQSYWCLSGTLLY